MRSVALLVALALPACTLEVAGQGETAHETQALTMAQKNAFWRAFKDEDIAANWNSENGGRAWGSDYLAWNESFRQRALVDMYVASGDVAFLDKLVERADVVFSLRDDRIARRDEVRGKVMPAWGRYPNVGRVDRTGDWVCEALQNGLITYPLAEFLRIADNDPALRARYGGRLAGYRARLAETVTAFDDDWDDGGDEGFYRFPRGYAKVYQPYEGMYLPYHRALALGSTMAALIESNIDDQLRERLRERVRKLGRFFLSDARIDDGAYVWRHAPWTTQLEDVSHAGIDVEFVAAAARVRDTAISRDHVARFVATFERIAHDPSRLDRLVDGTAGGDQSDNDQACGRWLALSALDRSVRGLCRRTIEYGRDPMQLAYARTLRYR